MDASAIGTASVWLPDSLGDLINASAQRHGALDRYLRIVGRRRVMSSDRSVDVQTQIKEPVQISPQVQWHGLLQQRIKDSVALEGHQLDPNLRYLSEAVARSALCFFEGVSDLLPSEPYIYASQEGNLVAEFSGSSGGLSVMIGTDFAILFSSSEDQSKEYFYRRSDEPSDVRAGVKEAVAFISANLNGKALES